VDSRPLVAALIFRARFTAPSKNSATFSKSSSVNPLEVSAGVPEIRKQEKHLL
jgi:hypothetical protein